MVKPIAFYMCLYIFLMATTNVFSKVCVNPQPLLHGEVLGPGPYEEGAEIYYTCNASFILSDGNEVSRSICINGMWKPSAPLCEPLIESVCTDPPLAIGGIVPPGPFSNGVNATITCLNNSKAIDVDTATCLSGVWQPTVLTCTKVCPDPLPLLNGEVLGPRPYIEGAEIYYFCNEEFILSDGNEVSRSTCTNSEWKPSAPLCEPLMCTDPPLAIEGTVPPGPFANGENVTVTCLNNSKAIYVDTATCLSGVWQPTALTCTRVCSDPQPLLHGEVLGPGPYWEGVEIYYFCNASFVLSGGMEVSRSICTFGEWKPSAPLCEPKICADPPLAIGGTVSPGPYANRGNATITCLTNYMAKEVISATCLAGVWQPTVLTCTKVFTGCVDPPKAVGGSIRGGTYQDGDTAQIVCFFGNEAKESTSLCSAGSWSYTSLTCSPKSCAVRAVTNGIISFRRYVHGDSATIICDRGYRFKSSSTCIDGQWRPPTFGCIPTASPHFVRPLAGRQFSRFYKPKPAKCYDRINQWKYGHNQKFSQIRNGLYYNCKCIITTNEKRIVCRFAGVVSNFRKTT